MGAWRRFLEHLPASPFAGWVNLIVSMVALTGLLAGLAFWLASDSGNSNASGLSINVDGAAGGSADQRDKLVVQPGTVVDVNLRYANLSKAILHDVTLRVDMPPELTYVAGSISWSDANHGGEQLSDSALGSGGVNLGNYGTVSVDQTNGLIHFRARVTVSARCTSMITAFGRATEASNPVSDFLVLLLDHNGDGDADVCPTTADSGSGYGPTRDVFDYSREVDRAGSLSGPVFNSFVNTPSYGDERAFVDVRRLADTQVGAYHDKLHDVAGSGELVLRAYIHNNANQTLNEGDRRGIARNTRVRLEVPAGVANGFTVQFRVSADNASPAEVYDTAELVDDSRSFSIAIVPGSARIYNGAHPDGLALPDQIATSHGAAIGFDEMNGDFRACFEFEAVVQVRLLVTASS